MIYSDEELKKWWQGLSVTDQRMTLQLMLEKATGPSFKNFAESLKDQWAKGIRPFTPGQLASIRKWSPR